MIYRKSAVTYTHIPAKAYICMEKLAKNTAVVIMRIFRYRITNSQKYISPLYPLVMYPNLSRKSTVCLDDLLRISMAKIMVGTPTPHMIMMGSERLKAHVKCYSVQHYIL